MTNRLIDEINKKNFDPEKYHLMNAGRKNLLYRVYEVKDNLSYTFYEINNFLKENGYGSFDYDAFIRDGSAGNDQACIDFAIYYPQEGTKLILYIYQPGYFGEKVENE